MQSARPVAAVAELGSLGYAMKRHIAFWFQFVMGALLGALGGYCIWLIFIFYVSNELETPLVGVLLVGGTGIACGVSSARWQRRHRK